MISTQFKAKVWILIWFLFSILVSLITSIPILPVAWITENGVNANTFSTVWNYLTHLFDSFQIWAEMYISWMSEFDGTAYNLLPWIPFLPGLAITAYGIIKNPYSLETDVSFGDARYSETKDIKKMGLLKGDIFVLGKWKQQFLQLPETLSVLSFAPPGTGKTSAIVVPSILKADNMSLIINDLKPEIADITSGYRAKKSRVFRLEWAAEDDPDNNIFYPCWNPLSPKSIPPAGTKRDLYLDRLINVLTQSNSQSGGDGNLEYFQSKARSAMAGFLHYIIAKCEHNNTADLPRQWQGKEPSFPMFQDWLAEAQIGLRSAGIEDPLQLLLQIVIKESIKERYSQRIINELNEVLSCTDRERASIMSVMNESLSAFKNSSVRARTSHSDFDFSHFRGYKNPKTKKWEPLTVYLCVNQEDSKTLSAITALFCEALSSYLVANPPGKQLPSGETLGPYAVGFILDEFPQMPRLQSLIDGPAVGRGQKISYMMIGQDFSQVEEKYGTTGIETLLSTTSAKVILPLNNEKTAQRFTQMVGKTTITSTMLSTANGQLFKSSCNKSITAKELISPDEFMSMPEGKHIVLYQKFLNRPILSDSPFYFKDRQLKKLVGKAYGGQQKIAPPLPSDLLKERKRNHKMERGK